MPAPFTTPVAKSVPFDKNDGAAPAFASEDCQAAIFEARNTARGTASRYVGSAGFDGNASTGRWLEFSSSVESNVAGLVIAEPSVLRSLSIAVAANSTTTATIFKNGAALTTISLSAARKQRVTGLNLSLAALDELSVQITAGSCTRPLVSVFIQTL